MKAGTKKGTSYWWKTKFQVVDGLFATAWLTAIYDNRWCYRLDNYIGTAQQKMYFWEYVEEANISHTDVKSKEYVENDVAASHYVFRNFMGSVDQSDVKSFVMGLCRERVSAWHRKLLPFLIEAAII